MNLHPLRDQLMAEVHARPATPIEAPMLVTRYAAVSGQAGAEEDRAHMTALCQRLGEPPPAPDARWCAVDGGGWQLRWERHSEFSSWTMLWRPDPAAPLAIVPPVPADWLAALPGPVLVLTTIRLRRGHHGDAPTLDRHDAIGTRLLDGAATLHTDLKPDANGTTRFHLVVHSEDAVIAGRLVLALLEIETYRMMALLAFPVAGEAAIEVRRIETEAGALASRIADDLGVEDDRALLTRLVALSGEMEALSTSTTFRFGAGDAYYEIVQGRIAALREEPLPGMQTIGQFMERRLGPAMRTCTSVANRERAVIARIARAGQMLNTRIELVTQQLNAGVLESMDRRADAQLRLQRTVEGLSIAAISYYVLQLLLYPLRAIAAAYPHLSADILAALLTPVIVIAVGLTLRRLRGRISGEAARA